MDVSDGGGEVSEIRLIEPGDQDEASDLAKAKLIAETLERFYPNHPWLISFQGRAIIVRHLAIAAAVSLVIGREGFGSVLPANKLDTPQQIRQSSMKFGGQLLEAFKLPRGAWDGRPPQVPENWKVRQSSGFN